MLVKTTKKTTKNPHFLFVTVTSFFFSCRFTNSPCSALAPASPEKCFGVEPSESLLPPYRRMIIRRSRLRLASHDRRTIDLPRRKAGTPPFVVVVVYLYSRASEGGGRRRKRKRGGHHGYTRFSTPGRGCCVRTVVSEVPCCWASCKTGMLHSGHTFLTSNHLMRHLRVTERGHEKVRRKGRQLERRIR